MRLRHKSKSDQTNEKTKRTKQKEKIRTFNAEIKEVKIILRWQLYMETCQDSEGKSPSKINSNTNDQPRGKYNNDIMK